MSPVEFSKTLIIQTRIRKLLSLMEELGWDLLILYGHSWRKDFFRTLIDLNFYGPHAAAAVTRSGEVTLLLSDPWDAQEGRAAVEDCEIKLEPNFEAGLGQLVDGHQDGVVAIGAMELMEARFVVALTEALLQEPVSATPQMERIRMTKNPEEIEALGRAAQLADLGYAHFHEVIAVGMREYELAAEVEGVLKSKGAQDNFMLMASGKTEVRGMKPPTDRRFQEGDCVTVELTPQVDGYYAQICRSLVLGKPSAEQQEAFSIFYRAREAGQAALRPGVDISDVARAQNDVFREAGFGEYTGPKYTRVRGHGLGLHFDENPYVLEEVHWDVEEGMVFILHPNTYLPLAGYMVLGDSLVVTETGCRSLNETDRRLFVA